MKRYSNNPNGVMMAVLGMSAAEDGAPVQAIGEVLHVRQGVPVWRCDGVEPSVVAAGSPGAVLLGHHVEGGRPGGVGPADDTLLTGSGMLMLTSCSGVRAAMSAAALRGGLTSFGAAGALSAAASDLGRILTSCCGGLSAAAAAAKMAEMGWPVLSIT